MALKQKKKRSWKYEKGNKYLKEEQWVSLQTSEPRTGSNVSAGKRLLGNRLHFYDRSFQNSTSGDTYDLTKDKCIAVDMGKESPVWALFHQGKRFCDWAASGRAGGKTRVCVCRITMNISSSVWMSCRQSDKDEKKKTTHTHTHGHFRL